MLLKHTPKYCLKTLHCHLVSIACIFIYFACLNNNKLMCVYGFNAYIWAAWKVRTQKLYNIRVLNYATLVRMWCPAFAANYTIQPCAATWSYIYTLEAVCCHQGAQVTTQMYCTEPEVCFTSEVLSSLHNLWHGQGFISFHAACKYIWYINQITLIVPSI